MGEDQKPKKSETQSKNAEAEKLKAKCLKKEDRKAKKALKKEQRVAKQNKKSKAKDEKQSSSDSSVITDSIVHTEELKPQCNTVNRISERTPKKCTFDTECSPDCKHCPKDREETILKGKALLNWKRKYPGRDPFLGPPAVKNAATQCTWRGERTLADVQKEDEMRRKKFNEEKRKKHEDKLKKEQEAAAEKQEKAEKKAAKKAEKASKKEVQAAEKKKKDEIQS